MNPAEKEMKSVLQQYCQSFSSKAYPEENDDHDVLMDAFDISPELKRENRQYWGRELGMCWELIVVALFQETVEDYAPAFRIGDDVLSDLCFGEVAIDTKYRIGSGDAGTLKKFKQYAKTLTERGYEPTLLIVRDDNLRAAIRACERGGWSVKTGDETFRYIEDKTGVDLYAWLKALGDEFHISR